MSADERQPADPAGAPVAPPRVLAERSWTLADSVALEGRAYGWLIVVVLPALSLLPTLVGLVVVLFPSDVSLADATATLPWVLLVPVLSAVPAFVASVVVLPVTWLVGRRLRRVRSGRAHVAWTALTAAVLATVTTAIVALLALGGTADPVAAVGSGLPMGLAAGVAGALARRGQLRRAGLRALAGPDAEPAPLD